MSERTGAARSLAARRQSFSPERTLWIIGLGVALSLLGDLTLYVVLPTHTAPAGIALADVGLMLSANRLIRIVLNGPLGVLIERVPRRRIAVPALFCGVASSLLYTVPGFWTLLVGRLLWGTAWAGVWLSASTMTLDISTGDNRGRFVSRLQMWFFIGSGMSSLIGGVLTDWLGYVAAFRVCALITLVGAVVWWLLLPETQTTHHAQLAHGGVNSGPQSSPGQEHPPNRYPGALIAAIILLGVNWLIFLGVLGATLPLLLEDRVGDEIHLLGLLIPLATFTGAISASSQGVSLLSSLGAGWLSDYIRKRWGLVIVALVIGVVALGVTAVGTGIVVVLATLLGAVATSVLQTQVMTLVGDYTSARRGRILGVLNTVGDLGSAGGPLLAYALLPVIHLGGIFGLATVLLAAMLPWTVWIARRETQFAPSEAGGA